MASGSKLKVVALISGGKDSLFSILHCLANGHEVVALGNLYPDNVKLDDGGRQLENEQDTDSYMFQTVGHSIIDLYAEALALPLYRRPLTGRAVDDSLNYSPAGTRESQPDEAEDLYLLLQDILKDHPTVNAVSTGAILSTYQRMRVESVAIRLNLVPLSYLWQYPYLPPHHNDSLLRDMYNAGMDSRLIKVASGGLDESFLGTSVNDPTTVRRMQQRMQRFDPAVGAILGEGGEFETLAVAGPWPLWKKQIVVTQSSVKSDAGGSSSLLIQKADLRDYPSDQPRKQNDSLRVPPLLDSDFQLLLKDFEVELDPLCAVSTSCSGKLSYFSKFTKSVSAGDLLACKSRPLSYTLRGYGLDSLAQMADIVDNLDVALGRHIIDTTLLLRDMADFPIVNTAYSKLFTSVLPPARVTVAVGDLLPDGCNIVLTITVLANEAERRGLHVQSRSYWAPANIGPYSQAISEPILNKGDADLQLSSTRLIHVAGQIPLVPASMNSLDEQYIKTLVSGASPEKWRNVHLDACVALALQHLWRTGRETQVKAWSGGIAYVNGKLDDWSRTRVVGQAVGQWTNLHHYWHDRQLEVPEENGGNGCVDRDAEDVTRPMLPDMTALVDAATRPVPPCFAVLVADLPRGVPIEWWSLGLSSGLIRQQAVQDVEGLQAVSSTCLTSGLDVLWLAVKQHGMDDLERRIAEIPVETTTIKAFSTRALPLWLSKFNVQLVPVFAIWDERRQPVDLLLVLTRYNISTGT